MSKNTETANGDKDKVKNKCPKCGRPWSFGVLGSGTLVEIQCGNRVCKERFIISVR